mmetsp:Transcript_60364/g.107596  ORF Transcript_60364/g.107596 Transcript_60364/m.107596 type:complete len:243 (-) Transcript_60364:273-1001(-)
MGGRRSPAALQPSKLRDPAQPCPSEPQAPNLQPAPQQWVTGVSGVPWPLGGPQWGQPIGDVDCQPSAGHVRRFLFLFHGASSCRPPATRLSKEQFSSIVCHNQNRRATTPHDRGGPLQAVQPVWGHFAGQFGSHQRQCQRQGGHCFHPIQASTRCAHCPGCLAWAVHALRLADRHAVGSDMGALFLCTLYPRYGAYGAASPHLPCTTPSCRPRKNCKPTQIQGGEGFWRFIQDKKGGAGLFS